METNSNNFIYLAGGGDEKQTFLFDEKYFNNLPINANLLYIPIALRGHAYYTGAPTWLRGLIDLHDRQDIKMETWTEINDKNFSDLEKFDTIFIGGGNTWSLIKEIKESNFDKLLIRFLAEKGTICGGSAGAIILGKRIITPDDNEVSWGDESGLDLLGGYSVACHFRPDEESGYLKLVKDNNLNIICLPEETGAIVGNQKISIVGEKPSLKITPQNSELVKNGEVIELSDL